MVTHEYDYAPFGELVSSVGARERLGYIGKEKDKESNLGDFGVRKYDDELGRFTTIEPLWEKYYSSSPYIYSYNNPITLFDPNGKDVLIAFSGANFFGGKDCSVAGQIVNTINQYAIDNKISNFHGIAFPTQGYPTNFFLKEAISFIKDNLKEGEKLILYGYSVGGVAAKSLAESLNENNIKVDLLITVDAAFGPGSAFLNHQIPENVDFNINYFQRSFSWILSRGDLNTAKNSNTAIINIEKDESHTDIDDATQQQIVNEIESTITK